MVATSSQSINFSSGVDDGSISIELDEDYHIKMYGEAKTEFDKSEIVYMKVTPTNSEVPYTILTSEGECTITSPDSVEEVTEQLIFEDEKIAELSNTPEGEVTTTWITGNEDTVLISEKEITTAENVVGILECTYSIKFDRLQLHVNSDIESDVILVVVENESAKTSQTVDFIGATSTLRDVTLVIKNIVSDEVIAGAEVTVSLEGNEIFSGFSNVNGKVTIQDMIEGATYDLDVKATNYLDSDSDYLNNDSFTVPSTEDE